ncbi:cupin domain-containing protein [Umezawaea tangerina]|uniref:ChrR-like protein with cupin domain n=1 Tax=Umezawaea tangerina TaxID=84725 RepID=A0A2T0T547_9PSEU|nr:cupin domain-containing protein [Umezawaea tangerina]PRY40759.1 ChrR-like protein with cupin domain [Umezawaea tangerina]
MKQEREFFAVEGVPWAESGVPGVRERVLSAADEVVLTRVARWAAGVDTSEAGVIRHEYVEEVYLLEGDLTDLTSGETYGVGHYACRPPGMPHGPYRTVAGCTMLEIRYREQPTSGV